MEETLRQLGELLLGSIPTVVIVLIAFGAYNALVARPLHKALAERYARTEGAFQQARQDIAAAETRTQEYEQRLRDARSAMFKTLERRRQQALAARTAAAAEARAAAEGRVRQARQQIEQDVAAARAGLQQESERLAGAIIQTVLHPGAAVGGAP
jgi:F-type H+-transporting ATPase subunit b